MALTRGSSGITKPRIYASIDTAPERKRRTTTTTKRRGGTKKSSTLGGVSKRKAPATHHKRKPHLGDKIGGAIEKVTGKLERKPGKEAAGTKKMRGTDGKRSRGRARI